MTSFVVHPAIRTLLDEPTSSAGVSTLSAVVAALNDTTVATELVHAPSARAVLSSLMKNLVVILNDRAKNTAVRVMCLESLFALSHVPDTAFREGLLFDAVQQFSDPVEEMMREMQQSAVPYTPSVGASVTDSTTADAVSGASAVEVSWEMLTVLLFRCSGYSRLKASDLLIQICNGEVQTLGRLLLRIVQRRDRCEWPLLEACLRCFYELTTPVCYYSSSATSPSADGGVALETIQVQHFQQKIQLLMDQLKTHHLLEQLFDSLRISWASSVKNESQPALAGGLAAAPVGLGSLGSPDVVHTIVQLSAGQQEELLHWLICLRFIAMAVQNLIEFSSDAALVDDLRRRLLSSPSGCAWMTEVALPAVIAAIHAWVRAYATVLMQNSSAAAATAPPVVSPQMSVYLHGALAILRIVRFAFYKSTAPFAAPVVSVLHRLTTFLSTYEPYLQYTYAGMLTMLLSVEVLINMNAAVVTAPLSLAEALQKLFSTIANDKRPWVLAEGDGTSPYAVMHLTVAEGFVMCQRREESSFCATANESVQLLHTSFTEEEKKMNEAAELDAELDALAFQLEFLQFALMNMALTQLMSGLAGSPLSTYAAGSRPSVSAVSATDAGSGSPSKKKKKTPNPPQYCCDLTGKLMREPVVLKNGHRFEYDALQKIMEQVGHVDPISGEVIDDDVDVDEDLKQEIAAYRVSRAAAKKG